MVPVGENTLGRIFNVLGEPIDNKEKPKTEKKLPIHRKAPSFEDQSTETEILETGIKVVDLLCPRRWKDGSDPGADPEHRHGARRLFCIYRSRRAYP